MSSAAKVREQEMKMKEEEEKEGMTAIEEAAGSEEHLSGAEIARDDV